MLRKFEVIACPDKFRLKDPIDTEPEATTTTSTTDTTTTTETTTTTTEGFEATTTTTTGTTTTTTTTEAPSVQYVYYDDGATYWRKGVRDGWFVWDRALDVTGFDGIEDVNWENVRSIYGVVTTTT